MDIALHTGAEQKAEHDHTDFPHHDWAESWVCTENEHIFKFKQTARDINIWNPIAYWQRCHAWSIDCASARIMSAQQPLCKTMTKTSLLCSVVSSVSNFRKLRIRNVLTQKYLLARLQKSYQNESLALWEGTNMKSISWGRPSAHLLEY